ncbi:terpenoid synthase [Ganoderma leucocontextum]|nr:terpenoid synthase [Ganoderma leucocontextum]
MASHIDSPDEGPPLGYLPIPDMVADWPWQRKINPLYEEVAAEGNAWLRSFLPFNLKSQHAFEKGDFGLLAALTFPDVPRDQLRTCVDLFNVFFLVDEYTDVEPAPKVREIIEVSIDALHNPRKPRPDGEVIIGEVVRQFWDRGRKTVPHHNGEPFVASLVDYLHAVAAQAEARDSGTILRTADAYLAIRREDAGVRPLYVLGALFLSIPDHLHDDPPLTRLTRLGCDLVAIDNDVLSYNREQAAGNVDFSIVTITMHDNGLSPHDAARSLVERIAELEAQFMQCHEFCSFGAGGLDGPSDSRVQRYMDHMGNMRRAIWCWSFECGRYFGERGSTYAKTQVIPLIPKKIRDPNLHGNQVDVFLIEEELAKM